MARNKTKPTIDFSKFQIALVNSGVQKDNNALFQTLNQLIEALQDFKTDIDTKFQTLGIEP